MCAVKAMVEFGQNIETCESPTLSTFLASERFRQVEKYSLPSKGLPSHPAVCGLTTNQLFFFCRENRTIVVGNR